MVGCDWCISILTVPARSYSLYSPVVFLDPGHPRFGNFNSAIPVDVIRVKSYVDSFLDPTGGGASEGLHQQTLPHSKEETAKVWVRASRISLSCSLILSCIDIPVYFRRCRLFCFHRESCFTMETGNDSKIAFLDTSVSREPNGGLTTRVYRKPTHTDQYLAYDSHHPQSVKRRIVKCLYDWAKRLVICHLYLSLTDIPPSLCRRSARQELLPEKSPQQNSNPPPFYPTNRKYWSLFATA